MYFYRLDGFDSTYSTINSQMDTLQSEERWDLDANGMVDWRLAWRKELRQLEMITESQEKAGASPEWYRQMLFRLRTAMNTPFDGPMDGQL